MDSNIKFQLCVTKHDELICNLDDSACNYDCYRKVSSLRWGFYVNKKIYLDESE